ncbi:dTDP-4-dehydrorhamnose 3,5-epimerase [Dissulfurispira thermophila]|uniref:dTDP-4-dehydrorhamnose 3,5-epimerase n=1 Tax=Dissulfurispira thermophila TaxID=2715679 RepID=A0A7G1H3B4_9BACT|nr:dTDP-4-dehydrorhamnose 3,5-epimerase [Dissulfurispira thermophila]BCB97300.1 dTDP-4-dehydrorhamnose 3,5-epimerase [Dissulfurispira thermophila]
MPFNFKRLYFPEVVLIEPKIFEDNRGFFMEIYKYSDFSKFGIRESFVQDNYSKSAKDVLRGLHYQKNPMAQGKLVRCFKGEIFDVVVDIRKDSPTYSQWISIILSEENNLMLYIPPVFAHGFVVLSDYAEVVYKCSKEYSPDHEKGIIWNDPDINIKWPVENPILSEKDKKRPPLKFAENNFRYLPK